MEPKFKKGELAWLNFSLLVQEQIAKAGASFIYKRSKKRTEVTIVDSVVDNAKFTVHYVVSLDASPTTQIANVPEVDVSAR